jgi:hypothetical protein
VPVLNSSMYGGRNKEEGENRQARVSSNLWVYKLNLSLRTAGKAKIHKKEN